MDERATHMVEWLLAGGRPAKERDTLGEVAWNERCQQMAPGSWSGLDEGTREFWCRIADAVAAAVKPRRPGPIVEEFVNGHARYHEFANTEDATRFCTNHKDRGLVRLYRFDGLWTYHPASSPVPMTGNQETAS